MYCSILKIFIQLLTIYWFIMNCHLTVYHQQFETMKKYMVKIFTYHPSIVNGTELTIKCILFIVYIRYILDFIDIDTF